MNPPRTVQMTVVPDLSHLSRLLDALADTVRRHMPPDLAEPCEEHTETNGYDPARHTCQQADPLLSTDQLCELIRERDKYMRHSIILNSVSWRIAEALGKVGPQDAQREGDVEADLTELLELLSAWSPKEPVNLAGEPFGSRFVNWDPASFVHLAPATGVTTEGIAATADGTWTELAAQPDIDGESLRQLRDAHRKFAADHEALERMQQMAYEWRTRLDDTSNELRKRTRDLFGGSFPGSR